MKRREFFLHSGIAAVALTMQRSAMAAAEQVIHLDPALGTDSNPGTREAPMRTLAAAAKRINAIQEPSPTTLILNEGIYALDETAVFKPTRPYSKTERLTIRAAVLPDDPDWNQARMPTLVHAMALSHDWNGRPDPFDGVAYGIKIETSHVTIQGLRISGMPIIEHPKTRAIHRLYAIGRGNQIFDDLEVKQCLFVGDEVTNPLHAGLLVSGTGLVVDHCLFYNVKQGAVYLTPRSTGHAMRNCLTYGSYACAIWISGVASDLDYRNNVVSNSDYVWIGETARAIEAEMAQFAAGRGLGPPPSGPPADAAGRSASERQVSRDSRYKVQNCLFAGNKKFTGLGAGPALNFRDNDPSFLELIDTKITDQPIVLEFDQTKRNYLHAVAGSEAAKIGAGLFQSGQATRD
jgi:hypothetical protein